MLTDHWIIVHLIGQVSTYIIFFIAFFVSLNILVNWNISNSTEGQLLLERKTYLVSVILHFVLSFQFILLILFIEIVNSHLPDLINGAMCAEGTLGVNAFGFPVLYLKIVSLVFYAGFIFINFLDQSDPHYPLTPGKYKVMPFLFLLITFDLLLTVQYFNRIEPDVIATCCSISFTPATSIGKEIWEPFWGTYVNLSHYYFFTLFLLVLLFYFYKHVKLILFITLLNVLTTVILLKEHFIRYIYARPTHNCLFDLFWRDYSFVGYLLYGLLFYLVLMAVFMNIYIYAKKKLRKEYKNLNNKLRYSGIISLILYTIIIHLYWLNWIVNY